MKKYIAMATGGGIDYDAELDEVSDIEVTYPSEEEEEVDTTQPFPGPGAASTPYHGGEQHEMQTMQHEQSGLPDTSYEETPFLTRTGSISDLQNESLLRQKMKKAIDMIKSKFPKAKFESFKIRRGTGKNVGKVVAIGVKGGEYKILKDDESDLTKSFFDSFKKKLGPRAEEILAQDRDTIQEQRHRLTEAEDQERRTNKLVAEKEKKVQEVENLRQKIERINARIDSIHDEHGSNLEIEAEINSLNQLKKNYQRDLDSAKKDLISLEKEIKKKEKTKANADRERAKLAQMVKERNEIEEGLNNTKPLDELKERVNEINRQNEEDQAIIQDENTTPSERKAAEARVAERTEERDRLQTQVGERESAMPLRERVREIFKQHGLTITAILLAAGITIGAVVGVITNALKSMGNQLANGLKDVGAKAASALPGLIGSILSASFSKPPDRQSTIFPSTPGCSFSRRLFSFLKSTSRSGVNHEQQGNNSDHANNYRGFVYFMLRSFIFWRLICCRGFLLWCFHLWVLRRHGSFMYRV